MQHKFMQLRIKHKDMCRSCFMKSWNTPRVWVDASFFICGDCYDKSLELGVKCNSDKRLTGIVNSGFLRDYVLMTSYRLSVALAYYVSDGKEFKSYYGYHGAICISQTIHISKKIGANISVIMHGWDDKNMVICSSCNSEVIYAPTYSFRMGKQYHVCDECYLCVFKLIGSVFLDEIGDDNNPVFNNEVKRFVDSGELEQFSVMCRLASPSTWGSV